MVSNLDNDAYAAIELPSSEHIHKITGASVQCLVLQSSYPVVSENRNSTKILRPIPVRAFAVVDRSCTNLKSAAAEIAQIKFLYGGTSPFAPAFVLVHEVFKAEFLREFLTAITKYFPENIPVNGKEKFERLSEVQTRLTSSKAGYGRILMSGNTSSPDTVQLEVPPMVIDGNRTRGSELCEMAENAPILPIFSIRSLDDAIDYASNMYTSDRSSLTIELAGRLWHFMHLPVPLRLHTLVSSPKLEAFSSTKYLLPWPVNSPTRAG
jgi:hypothetical protein